MPNQLNRNGGNHNQSKAARVDIVITHKYSAKSFKFFKKNILLNDVSCSYDNIKSMY